ncbi:DUF4339 domain-containing protein [Myxococcaceae bacterium JPH2]|nr:DUF4339 domain-containing protein [Myxococcaceae bacterium JPH2]
MGSNPEDGGKPPATPAADRSSVLGEVSESELDAFVGQLRTARNAVVPRAPAPRSRWDVGSERLHRGTRYSQRASPLEGPPEPPKEESPPSHAWYAVMGGRITGPYDVAALRGHWQRGELHADSLCWREGLAAWQPIHQLTELREVLAAAAATSPGATPAQVGQVQPAQTMGQVGPVHPAAPAQATQAQAGRAPVSQPTAPAQPAPSPQTSWGAEARATTVDAAPVDSSGPTPQANPEPLHIVAAPRDISGDPTLLVPMLAGDSAPSGHEPSSEAQGATRKRRWLSGLLPLLGGGLLGGAAVAAVLVYVGNRGASPPLVTHEAAPAPQAQAPLPETTVPPPAPPPTQDPALAAPTAPIASTPSVATDAVHAASPVASTPAPTAGAPIAALRAPVTAAPDDDDSEDEPPPSRKGASQETEADEGTPLPPLAPEVHVRASAVAPLSGRARVQPEVTPPPPHDAAPPPPAPPKEPGEELGPDEAYAHELEHPPARPPPPKPSVWIPPDPSVKAMPATLAQEDIFTVVLANQSELATCAALPGATSNEGKRVIVRWSILPNGRVTDVLLENGRLRGTPMARCIEGKVRAWTFTPHREQGEPVRFPFVF